MAFENKNPLTIGELILGSFRALRHPIKAFLHIDSRPIAYLSVIPYVFAIGVLWIQLHGFLLFTEPLWINTYRWFFYSILFGFFALSSWLITAFVLLGIARFFKVSVSLAYIERGVFCILFVWMLMPIFDIVHLWFPVWLVDVGIFGVHPIHASHIFAGIFIPLEVFGLLYTIFGRNRLLLILPITLIVLPLSKIVGEDLGFLVERFFYQAGIIAGKYDDYVFGYLFNVPFWIGYLILRAKVMMWPRRFSLFFIVPFSVAVICIGVFMMYVVKPKFPGYASDSGYLDSSDGVAREHDYMFIGMLNLPFDPAIRTPKKISCIVRLLAQTNNAGGDNFPKARCDIRSFLLRDTNEFSMTGSEWSGLNGSSEQVTTWTDKAVIQTLSQYKNDIRVHVETSTGDIVVFSGIWVEVE